MFIHLIWVRNVSHEKNVEGQYDSLLFGVKDFPKFTDHIGTSGEYIGVLVMDTKERL